MKTKKKNDTLQAVIESFNAKCNREDDVYCEVFFWAYSVLLKSLQLTVTQCSGEAMARLRPVGAMAMDSATVLFWMASRAARMSVQAAIIRCSCEGMARLWPVGAMAMDSATLLRLMAGCAEL